MSQHAVDVDASNFQQVVLEGSREVPVVIDFWAPWCAPCRTLKPILEKLAAEYAGRFVLAKINSDENPDLAGRFGVRGIPAVKAVYDGALVDEFTGALPESQVRQFIERIMPTESDLLRKEAMELAALGREAEALGALDRALAANPRNERAQIDKLGLLVGLERNDEARALLDDLNPLLLDDPRVAELKARLEFAPEAGDEGVEVLRQRVAGDPSDLDARLALARAHVRDQAYEEALEQLLEIVKRDRKFGDDIGRRTMIEVFNLLGGSGELVARYRRALSSALY